MRRLPRAERNAFDKEISKIIFMCNEKEAGVVLLVINLAPLLSRSKAVLEDVLAHIAVKCAVELTGRRVQDIVEMNFGVETVDNSLEG